MRKLKELYSEYKDDKYFSIHVMGDFRYMPFIIWLFRVFAPTLICRIFGHKWVSTDYGNPESGGIGVECTRCGESHFQRLY